MAQMTPQDKAEAWLAVWQRLRAAGLTPEERERYINDAIERHHQERLDKAVSQIRGNLSHPPNSE